MKQEIKPLTSLRAVAAALVFFYHVIYLRHPAPPQNLLGAVISSGFIGVTIFFVLSGFLMTIRYVGDVQKSGFQWGRFLLSRAARILPIYYFLLAGLALLNVPLNITNLTLTQGFFTRYVQTGDIVTWSLTVEIGFYLMLPPVLMLLVRLRNIGLIMLALLLWSFGMLALGMGLVIWSNGTGIGQSVGFMGDLPYMLDRTLFGYMFDFSAGIFAGFLFTRRGALRVNASTLLTIIGVVGIVGCQVLMTFFSPTNLTAHLLLRYGVDIMAVLLVYGLTCPDSLLARLLSWQPFVYLGRISYVLYLVQLTQLLWFMSDWPALVFYFGTNLVSAALYQFIEEPGRKLLLGKPIFPARPLSLRAPQA